MNSGFLGVRYPPGNSFDCLVTGTNYVGRKERNVFLLRLVEACVLLCFIIICAPLKSLTVTCI